MKIIKTLYYIGNNVFLISLSKELPSLEDIIADSKVDIENLESQFSSLSFKYSKTKTAAGSLKSPTNNKSNNQTIQKTKSKKKKKIKLPKNYDPSAPIDQERWLPLRERSYYKGRRNKKKGGVGKGTQGSVSTKYIAIVKNLLRRFIIYNFN